VGVEDSGARVVDLRPARGEQVGAECLILGVCDLAEADLLPAGPRIASVDVGEEGGVARALHHCLLSGSFAGVEAGEELC
jgi:hypothetical protein